MRLIEFFGVDEASPTGPGAPDYVKLAHVDFDTTASPMGSDRKSGVQHLRSVAQKMNVKVTPGDIGPNGHHEITIEGGAKDVARFMEHFGFDAYDEFEISGYDYEKLVGPYEGGI